MNEDHRPGHRHHSGCDLSQPAAETQEDETWLTSLTASNGIIPGFAHAVFVSTSGGRLDVPQYNESRGPAVCAALFLRRPRPKPAPGRGTRTPLRPTRVCCAGWRPSPSIGSSSPFI